MEMFPKVPHVAVFDTAFHHSMPDYAFTYGLPYDLCQKLGLQDSVSLETASWNGEALQEIYPWGTIRRATPEANRATAAELPAADREEIRRMAWQYLDVFDYASFAMA